MFFLLQQITGKFKPYRLKKIELFFCTSLGLHYLCTQKQKRKKYEERNRNY